jgi:hypothetical protein
MTKPQGLVLRAALAGAGCRGRRGRCGCLGGPRGALLLGSAGVCRAATVARRSGRGKGNRHALPSSLKGRAVRCVRINKGGWGNQFPFFA